MTAVKLFLRLAAFAVLALILTTPVTAAYFTYDPDETEKKSASDYASDFSEAIPEDLRDKLGTPDFADLFADLSQDPSDTPSASVWQNVLEDFLAELETALVPSLHALGSLLSVSVLAAAVRLAADSPPPAFTYLVRCTLAVSVLRIGSSSIDVLAAASERLCTVSAALTPAVCAMTAASGGVTSAALTRSGLTLVTVLCQRILSLVIIPAVRASLVLSAAAYVSGQKSASAVASALRTLAGVTCTAVMTAVSFIFNVRLKLGDAADGALVRTVRTALAGLIPIVGGSVSEAAGQLGASVAYLRATCGVICVAVVLLLTIPAIVRLILDRAVVFVCRHVCAAVSPEDEALFADLGASFTLMLAYAVSSAVTFILCFASCVRIAA